MGDRLQKSFDFAGRAAVISGGGGGMGFQVSRDLISMGADVLAIDVKKKPEGLDEGPGEATYVQVDITDQDAVDRVVSDFHKKTGRIDFLGNIAGLLLFEQDGSFADDLLEGWDRAIAVNLTGARNLAHSVVPFMVGSGGGSMVHISSIQCMRGDAAPQDGYAVAKAGILALSRSIAVQFGEKGIRSNAILPGLIMTPMQARLDDDEAMKEQAARIAPLMRLGKAEDIANMCLYLFSDLASFITGADFVVDGGLMVLPGYHSVGK